MNGKLVSKEEKQRAVTLYIQEGRTAKSLAAEYGVSNSSITNWVKQFRKECPENAESNAALNTMKEISKLRQENAALKKENEFLKKAAAFFAREID